jgi:methylisocitrate lyase
MITPAQKRRRLKTLLRTQAQLVPGAYDVLTALMIEDNGFHVGYVTGAGLSVGLLGKPDVGLLTLNDVVTVAERVSSVTSIPFLVDADTGFGDATNVAETVRQLESAGAAGLQLEDQEFPKRCGHLSGKRLVPAVEMIAKIRSAVAARKDPNFLIVARTDAPGVTGLGDALQRAQLYRKAGADVIFPEALESVQEFRLFGMQKSLGVLMANMTEFGRSPALTFQELSRLGYRLVLYPMTLFRAAAFEGNRVLQHLKKKGETRSQLPRLQTRQDLYRLIRYADYDERSNRALREATKILRRKA